MSSKAYLATQVALGLSLHLLDPPVSFGDIRLLTSGRIHLWPRWTSLDAEDQARVVRFLSHRPDELCEDGRLLDLLQRIVDTRDDFEGLGVEEPAGRWDATFELVAGRPLLERIDDWLNKLDRLRERVHGQAVAITGTAGVIELVADRRAYRVPVAHLPRDVAKPQQVVTHKHLPEILLNANQLRALACRLDEAGLTGPHYQSIAIANFLERFLDSAGRPVASVQAGPTQLAVAPTGSGKSVFARLLALHLASNGIPVALVVPDIQTVWKEAVRLVTAARSVHISMKVSALSSWRPLAFILADYLTHPPSDDPDARWALEQVAYSCHLAAYAEPADDAPEMGEEPCVRLRQRLSGESGSKVKEGKVECPFARQCGRFAGFSNSLDADIIVVNHHAFLAGRVPVQIGVDGSPARGMSTAELILRRCAVVLIDEVDTLQQSAIGANSRGLVLSSRGSLSKPIQLYTEVERRRAENRLAANLRFERGRSALLRIVNEAERLSELVNRKELVWPGGGEMTWRGAHDAWIAARLYDDSESGRERLRGLYDRELLEDDKESERLRQILAGPGLGDGTLMEEIRARLMDVLIRWPQVKKGSAETIQRERSKVVDRLILRAVLLQLDRALTHLRPQLPGLEQQEIPQATELRDALLGYAPWQPSPCGPLGQRLYGYAFSERLGEHGALETRVLSGDPHGLVCELGGLVARALAGEERVVIGFSATCRFRGAPRADVLGSLLGSVSDDARNIATYQATGKNRISGIGGRAERLGAARSAAEELWTTTLHGYLDTRVADPIERKRARALVVTSSYDEAAAVAQTLLKETSGSGVNVRYLVRKSEDDGDSSALPRRRIETFGQVPAPAVLVGPLSVVARGHNILQPGTQFSAISGIFVLTRPVPPSHDAARFLAHLSYNARLFSSGWRGTASQTIAAERSAAWNRLRALQRSAATFRNMDLELRRELVCDVLVELAQLAGRARRGGTSVDLVFVDAAFQDDVVPWRGLVREVLAWWKNQGWLTEMAWLHGAFLHGLAEYAGFQLVEGATTT